MSRGSMKGAFEFTSILLLLLAPGLAVGQPLGDRYSEMLIFSPVSLLGEPVDGTVTSLRNFAGDEKSKCKGLVCRGVSKGDYEYTLWLRPKLGPAFEHRSSSRLVHLAKRERVTVSLGVYPHYPEPAGHVTNGSVDGKVLGLPKGPRELWVRLVQLHAQSPSPYETRKETPIAADGRFLVESVFPGEWILIVLGDHRPLYLSTLKIQKRCQVVVDLNQPAKSLPCQ